MCLSEAKQQLSRKRFFIGLSQISFLIQTARRTWGHIFLSPLGPESRLGCYRSVARRLTIASAQNTGFYSGDLVRALLNQIFVWCNCIALALVERGAMGVYNQQEKLYSEDACFTCCSIESSGRPWFFSSRLRESRGNQPTRLVKEGLVRSSSVGA